MTGRRRNDGSKGGDSHGMGGEKATIGKDGSREYEKRTLRGGAPFKPCLSLDSLDRATLDA